MKNKYLYDDLRSMQDRGCAIDAQMELIAKYMQSEFIRGAQFQMANLHVKLFPNCKEAKEELAKAGA